MAEKRTILFVDDEVRLLRSIERGMIDEPYTCLFAPGGKEALILLEQNEVHVIVTDMRMPEMSGLDLLRIVKEKYPHIVRLVLSGYTQVTTLLTAINQGEIFRFCTKPWKMEEEFKPVIRQAVEYYDQQVERDRLAAELAAFKQAQTAAK
jgi:two-component system, NtrC family, response regulator HupR/HoxA